VPVYNQVRYLERSLLSILNQDYPNLELVVIDGGSTDGTIEVLEKYKTRITVFRSAPDRGQSDALNHGFAAVTGDIFGWLNSDDLYLPNAFEYAISAFSENPDAKVIFGDWWEIDSNDEVISINLAFDFNLHHFVYEGFHLNAQAMFWRREAHDRFGNFDIGLHRTMDYDLIVRLGVASGQDAFKRIPHPLGCFRRHPDQKTVGFDRIVFDEHLQIASKTGFSDKFHFIGRIYWFVYRCRRVYWYIKRGGFSYFLDRTRAWRSRLSINKFLRNQ